jgi:hypothetical protein
MKRRSQVQYRQNGGPRKDVPAAVYSSQYTKPKPKAMCPAKPMPYPTYRDDAIGVVQFQMFSSGPAFQAYEFGRGTGIYGEERTSVYCHTIHFVTKTGKLKAGSRGPTRWANWITSAHQMWVQAGKPETFQWFIFK